MAADNQLLDEFKELIETVSLEVIKEAQMKEVAKDVVTRSYKAEIADALEVISGEIDRVKQELEALDYISADEIKALVYGLYEKQESAIKDSEEHVKNIVSQNTQELYIATEKLRSDVATVGEQIEIELRDTNKRLDESINAVGNRYRSIQESFEASKAEFRAQTRKLFWINYGLMAMVIGLLIFIIIRGNYGA